MTPIPEYEEIVHRNFGVYSLEEQRRIRKASVALIGLGCVGGLVALMLARTGVGRMTLVDGDVYEAVNMNRQPFADTETLGLPKVTAAALHLSKANPHVKLKLWNERLTRDNADEILRGHDVAVQAVDHVPTRLVLHEKAASLGIPVVSMTGQPPYRGLVSTFLPGGPSYREVLSLPEEDGHDLHEKIRYERAKHAGRSTVDGWLEKFLRGEAAWAVTAEVTFVMGVLQAHEALRLLAGRQPRAPAPRAYVVNLDDPGSPVSLARPPSGGAWDYREF